MMKYACPHCNGHLKAGPEYSGKQVPCPHCGGLIDIPRQPATLPISSDPAKVQSGLFTHRLAGSKGRNALGAPHEWHAFYHVLIAWLACGAAAITGLLYTQRQEPHLMSIAATVGAAWLLVLTTTWMVRRRFWVRSWAAVFLLLALAALPFLGPIILNRSATWELRVAALIGAVATVAMVIVTAEALCVKRKPKSAPAKVIRA